MKHPRRALRDPLKGATLAARQSRSRGVLVQTFRAGDGSVQRLRDFV